MLREIKQRLDAKNRDQHLPGNKKHMAILIAYDIEEAEKITDTWNLTFKQANATCITSNLAPYEEEKAMQDVKGGKVTLLVIVQKLLEGFDHPPISIAAIATRIQSPVKFAQFIGRAQRICRGPDGEIEHKDIKADIMYNQLFKQRKNYETFEKESLIPVLEREQDDTDPHYLEDNGSENEDPEQPDEEDSEDPEGEQSHKDSESVESEYSEDEQYKDLVDGEDPEDEH